MNVVSRVLWGPTFDNVIDMGWPIDNLLARRRWRAGSRLTRFPSGAQDSIVTGRDYGVTGEIGWIPPDFIPTDYTATKWSGPLGVEAWITWCEDGNSFRLVPDITLPTNYVDGCVLKEPEGIEPRLEGDGTYRIPVTILHPTLDLLRVLQGVIFEYLPGMDIPALGGQFSRLSVGWYHSKDGRVLSVPADVVRDAHYIAGERTTLIEEVSQPQSLLHPRDLSHGDWTKTGVTATANAVTAPNGVKEAAKIEASGGTAQLRQDVTSLATYLADSIYVRKGSGATQANAFRIRNQTTSTDLLAVTINYDTGVITYVVGSSGAEVEQLGFGWWRLKLRVDTGISVGNTLRLSYGFDGGSATAGHYFYGWGANALPDMYVTSYMDDFRDRDVLVFPGGMGVSDMTVLADLARPPYADLPGYGVAPLGGAGGSRNLFNIRGNGGAPPEWNMSHYSPDGTNRLVSAFFQGQLTAALPAGASLRYVEQLRNPSSAPEIQLDIGAGFTGWTAVGLGSVWFAWLGTPLIGVGCRATSAGVADKQIGTGLKRLLIVAGLRSTAAMAAT